MDSVACPAKRCRPLRDLTHGGRLTGGASAAREEPNAMSDSAACACQAPLVESHVALTKQMVIKPENTIGIVKKYAQLRPVRVTKQSARVHAVRRTRTEVCFGRPASCQARTAASR